MTTVYSKDSATVQQPASLIKMLTAYVARQWVNDAHLDDTVTVNSSDLLSGSTANLTNGDVTTYRHLFFGMFLPSGNDAAHCVARNVGSLIIAGIGGGSSDPHTRFIEEMATQATALGLSGVAAGDAAGIDATDRLSPDHCAVIMAQLNADSFIRATAGTYTHTMVITGANARSYGVTNLFNPSSSTDPFSEHVASKFGWTATAGYCLTLLWDTPGAQRRITTVMGCATEAAMLSDMRRLVNFEIARSS